MIQKQTFFAIATVLICLLIGSVPTIVAQDAKAPYDGSWESLQKMPVPAWFDDGKIGIFIHWGPYSRIGYRKGGRGYSEHVPKMMYREPDHYFPIIKDAGASNRPSSATRISFQNSKPRTGIRTRGRNCLPTLVLNTAS